MPALASIREWFRRLDPFPRCFVYGRLTFANAEYPAPFPLRSSISTGTSTAPWMPSALLAASLCACLTAQRPDRRLRTAVRRLAFLAGLLGVWAGGLLAFFAAWFAP